MQTMGSLDGAAIMVPHSHYIPLFPAVLSGLTPRLRHSSFIGIGDKGRAHVEKIRLAPCYATGVKLRDLTVKSSSIRAFIPSEASLCIFTTYSLMMSRRFGDMSGAAARQRCVTLINQRNKLGRQRYDQCQRCNPGNTHVRGEGRVTFLVWYA